MTARLVAVVLASEAPGELARFWARALRWDAREVDDGSVELVPTDATSFSALLVPLPTERAGQNRIHFDLTTTSLEDQRDTVAELLGMGGTHVDVGQGRSATHVVLGDPDGNEFCVIEPDNRFLSTCPRLGAVTCDGTRELGIFFSEALGWPLVWDQGEETAIQAPDGTGPKITWSGPPLMPRLGGDRVHFHLAPSPGSSVEDALEHLLALGASRANGSSGCPGAIVLADVDGNELCLVEPEAKGQPA